MGAVGEKIRRSVGLFIQTLQNLKLAEWDYKMPPVENAASLKFVSSTKQLKNILSNFLQATRVVYI